MLRCRRALLALATILATSIAAFAQGTGTPPPQSAATPPAQTDATLLKPEQLDALVAPIALYPDALLANMLAAATYPLEVVTAARWVKDHKNLKGDQLKAEVDKQSWDDSVKALTSTPSRRLSAVLPSNPKASRWSLAVPRPWRLQPRSRSLRRPSAPFAKARPSPSPSMSA